MFFEGSSLFFGNEFAKDSREYAWENNLEPRTRRIDALG
jgi:hypothetical protein